MYNEIPLVRSDGIFYLSILFYVIQNNQEYWHGIDLLLVSTISPILKVGNGFIR
jgi:hypothetical protein